MNIGIIFHLRNLLGLLQIYPLPDNSTSKPALANANCYY